MAETTGGSDENDEEFAVTATQDWYDEVNGYNFKKPGFSEETSHFTQMVWKGNKLFGFGVARGNENSVAVALYSPGGNIDGQNEYRSNVDIFKDT